MNKSKSVFRTSLLGGLAFCALSATGLGISHPAQAGVPPAGAPFDDLPDAQPGECFARVMIPAQYETQYQDVVVDEGGNRIEVSPARFENRVQQIQVRDEGVRYQVRQPVYRTVHERVMVRPGYDKLVVVPAKYRTVSEQVVVSPARTAWKPGKSLADWSGVKATKNTQGEVYCLVEIPPQTRTVSKRVMVQAETTRKVWVPPVYRTITRQILVDRGGVQEIPVPGKVANLTVQELVQSAGQRSIALPPRHRKVARRVLVQPEQYKWIRVLCKTNATPAAISRVQTELQQYGYYHGPVDGQLGLSTETAVRNYQQAVGIPHAGYLSLDTINALQQGRTSAGASAYAEARASAGAVTNQMQRYAAEPAPQGVAGEWSYVQPSPQGALPGQALGYGQQHSSHTLDGGTAALNGEDLPVYREGQIISRVPGSSAPAGSVSGQAPARAPSSGPHLTWYGKS